MHKCPKCGSTNLKVSVMVWAELTQSPDNMETELDCSDHDWDGDSLMVCQGCSHGGQSRDFEQPEGET